MKVLFAGIVLAVALLFPAAADAAYTHVYKPRARLCSGCMGIGWDRNNYENWMYIYDCGGIFDDNCSHEVWEQNDWGNRYYTVYGGGNKVWVGRYHSVRYPGKPVCKTYTTSSQGVDSYCYQGYGY
jgi:hypothetical protein